ncbi:Golgin subfamily A member 1 [Tupaia chinensis]|uniref:Golgin subfamily A member 1 n=1 Tax=Tupaia chinensis TaxID=246437 RepID=L9JHK0_TUPCH|nr:Golgin subfamily A member 1 [Tupaia chinensis]
MFAKLKKKIAEETAVAQRPGGATRIPRSVSKESVASMGADSGDDFEWSEKVDQLEKEKRFLTAQLQEMKNQSLNLFQRRDEMDELEGFQQQELSKVKHMLLKKEESLGKMEQELEAQTRELSRTQEELMNSRQMSSDLSQKLEELQRHYSTLEEQRDHMTASKTGAENKITALKQKEQELQTFIQQLSIDLQNVTAETQEKEKLITHLQEKVTSLEKRLEQNLSGEEHVQELLKEVTFTVFVLDCAEGSIFSGAFINPRVSEMKAEGVRELPLVSPLKCSKTAAEQSLEDTRQQLLAARSSQAKAMDTLETRVKELEQMVQASEEQLQHSRDVVAAQEAQILELATANQESSHAQQQVLALEQQCAQRTHALQAQIQALESARAAEQTAAEQGLDEWSQREVVSVAVAQALEEVRKQREELQQQAVHLTAIIDEKEQRLQEKTEALLQKEQEVVQLEKGHDSALLQLHQLQSELEALRSLRSEEAAIAAAQDDLLRLQGQEHSEQQMTSMAVQGSVYQLPAGEGTPNGEVGTMDLTQLQKEKQDLEQQLSEKNKTIKQMQQRMLELKKTLQKELKIRPDNELFEVRERPSPEMANMTPSVTNNADLTDAREINFEYLKHVVLKFMSCRESEPESESLQEQGGCREGRRLFQQTAPNLILNSGAFSVSNVDVLVWIQASSQGQHPAIYLKPSDTMVLEETTQGWSSMG